MQAPLDELKASVQRDAKALDSFHHALQPFLATLPASSAPVDAGLNATAHTSFTDGIDDAASAWSGSCSGITQSFHFEAPVPDGRYGAAERSNSVPADGSALAGLPRTARTHRGSAASLQPKPGRPLVDVPDDDSTEDDDIVYRTHEVRHVE